MDKFHRLLVGLLVISTGSIFAFSTKAHAQGFSAPGRQVSSDGQKPPVRGQSQGQGQHMLGAAPRGQSGQLPPAPHVNPRPVPAGAFSGAPIPAPDIAATQRLLVERAVEARRSRRRR